MTIFGPILLALLLYMIYHGDMEANMAYGADNLPDPPDDGMDAEEREGLEEAEDRRIEAEIDRRMEDGNA